MTGWVFLIAFCVIFLGYFISVMFMDSGPDWLAVGGLRIGQLAIVVAVVCVISLVADSIGLHVSIG